MAAAKRYEVEIQLSKTASMANSLPMLGRAILIEEDIKGVRKTLRVATNNTVRLKASCFVLLLDISHSIKRVEY